MYILEATATSLFYSNNQANLSHMLDDTTPEATMLETTDTYGRTYSNQALFFEPRSQNHPTAFINRTASFLPSPSTLLWATQQ